MSGQPFIYSHADDFGMTKESCERILDCCRNGQLSRVSILPNGCLDYAAEKLQEYHLPCAVHINLVEGKALSPAKEVDLIADEKGYLKYDFLPLLLLSLSPKRRQLEQQLYREIRRQILAVAAILPAGTTFALDSHQHTHMIPLIFKTILRIVEEEHLPVDFMRIPAEPLSPFLAEPSLYRTYAPVNVVKNLILNFLWLFDKKAFRRSGLKSALFCGILFSGNMNKERVLKVYPHFLKLAQKKHFDMEFLFHPGYLNPEEEPLDRNKPGFCQFYLSRGRKNEAQTLCSEEWKAITSPH